MKNSLLLCLAMLPSQLMAAESPIVVPQSVLNKKFHGRATFDDTTRVLTVFYDFKKKTQLADFKGNPVWGKGLIGVPTGEHVLHVAKFKTVTVSGMVAMNSTNSALILTTGGFGAWRGGAGGIGITGPNNDSIVNKEAPDESIRAAPFEVILTHKMVFRLAGKEVGKERKDISVGQVKLSSGDAGTTFSQLKISGEVDAEWAKEFFGH